MYFKQFTSTRKIVTPEQADDIAHGTYYADNKASGAPLPESIYIYDGFWVIERFKGDSNFYVTVHNSEWVAPTLVQAELRLFMVLHGGQITENCFIEFAENAPICTAKFYHGRTRIDCMGDLIDISRSDCMAALETAFRHNWIHNDVSSLGLSGAMLCCNSEVNLLRAGHTID